ncbi:glycosyl hydrolase [Armatimonas sp.]|uniref:glycosyl hydrolase n=1 Tax=Armatimonas sp. TaxID=1872638 RepID=UPI00286B3ED0|nr:glycosyl hydrolase [Armatimonas sp.]
MNRRVFLASSFALVATPTLAQEKEPKEKLEKKAPQATPMPSEVLEAKSFQTPPLAARPHTWWHWMNGNISHEGITADLEAMAQAGIGGAQIFNVDQGIPLGKVLYMTPEWRQAMVHAAKEAKRLGIELCFHNCAGWSSSGGPWITPEFAMQVLTWSETTVTGGSKLTLTLKEPTKREKYYNDIAVLAVKIPVGGDTARLENIRAKALFDRGGDGLGLNVKGVVGGGAVINGAIPWDDVTVLQCTAEGKLTWEAPAGEWLLLRMGHTPTGAQNAPAPEAGRGLECDKLSREAIELHWEKGVAPVLTDMGPELVGKSFNNALIDSYEMGSQNWTPKLRRAFIAQHRYDPLPWMPVVTGRVIGSPEQSERFLWDWRRTIADLFTENYAGRFKELCHENKMQFSIEPYGNGPFDNLQLGMQGDILMGEFWVPGGGAGETVKIAASCAHVMGRKIVGAESFTASEMEGRWQVEPYGIKALGDRMFSQGVNRYIFHRYAHQPWLDLKPGMTMGPWGSHIERTQTWWKQAGTWLTYVARCQHLLQSGRFVADVLTFCGDDAPNDLYRPSLPPGYDYDGCDRTVLLTAKVDKGEVVLPSGARYKVLMIPDSVWLTPQTTAKLVELSKAGAKIVGRKPEKSPSLVGYPACDAEVKALGAQLTLTTLEAALPPPDVALPKGTPFVWLHRSLPDAEIYFVSNQRYTQQKATVGFRVAGRAPELWHPETGTTETAPLWTTDKTHTNVTLALGPAESVFVVFRKGSKPGKSFSKVERTGGPVAIAKPPVLEILSARYEAVDGAGGADVTAKVKELVAKGETEIPASNALFGDPINLHVKHLRISYTLDGKPLEKTVGENATLVLLGSGPDNALPEFTLTNGKLLAYTPGTYAFTDPRGAIKQVSAPALRETPLTAWELTFPGQEPRTLEKLVSWTEFTEPDAKYFSGTVTYKTSFTVTPDPTRAVILDLGVVKNFADVLLNGQAIATLWKAPWRVDITDLVRPGSNSLEIKLTNLWVNRLIGDEQLPPEEGVEWTGKTGPIKAWPKWLLEGKPRPATDRVTFTTWRYWTKDDKPLDSGLLGPARILQVPLLAF